MSDFNPGNQPGLRARRTSDEAQILWAGRGGQTLAATRPILIGSTAVDSGNSPTTLLRAGLVMGYHTSSQKYLPYDPDANDGTQIAVGILAGGQDMLVEGVATDRFTALLVSGLVKQDELHGLDARAKRQLAGRFHFDREVSAGVPPLLSPRGIVRKSASYTVVEADDGLQFLATAAVTFTLPTKKNGLTFRFTQLADANLTISGSADIVCDGNAAATSVAFSTPSHKIGSQALVECVYTATDTLKWLVTNLGGTAATVA